MQPTTWTSGQRWVSDSEPELGLGIVRSAGDGRVEIEFPAADERRCYATSSAPLRRVTFSPGDRIRIREGDERTITARSEHAGRWIYQTDLGEVPESQLCDSISFSKPEDRLFGGKLDAPGEFDLRGEALRRRAEMRQSPIRGLAGARMDLIPHQLFIADEVASRLAPRVLLADEVGLGKTIEACLILHRLLLTGRAARVLILVPEPLIHQWFVELLRRFALSFSLFDEERCQAIEHGDPESNPFLDSQWILAPIALLADQENRAAQAIAAGWDLLVVDEAHHLEWSPDAASPAYEVVRALAAQTESLLLLTATPQQLGPDGHFARLQLLDPQRYTNLAAYREETLHYEEVATAVEALEHRDQPAEMARLLDSFGVGRVMFRNTRRKLGGFPTREPHLIPLAPGDEARLQWLTSWLATLDGQKALIITHSQERATEWEEAIRTTSGIPTGLFHEGLTLLQRDRNAAHFAEPEGAQVLVCSEIGSEGRNFQFARHLVLIDLPEDVDLLEQRIGRLDRIGGIGTIHIHVPYAAGTSEETYARWLDEGLDAFRASPPGAAEIQREIHPWRGRPARSLPPSALKKLLTRTHTIRERIANRLARGQDRLLERTSHHPARAAALIEAIRSWDDDAAFENFAVRLFDYAGLHLEDLGARRYFLAPGHVKSDAFPALPEDGLTVTLDRRRAFEREQEAFLTRDHPLIRGGLDWLLGSESGNASFAVWENGTAKRILLEAWLVLECVAPPALHVERFLPQTPIRILVDHRSTEVSEPIPTHRLRAENPGGLLRNETVRTLVIPAMLDRIREIGTTRSEPIIAAAISAMQSTMDAEIQRLHDLAKINDHITPAEILRWQSHRTDLATAIRSARIRLDAVRLIWNTPS